MTRSILAAAFVVALATPVFAQTDVDVSRLPIDLERIHRQLQQTVTREEREGLTLR